MTGKTEEREGTKHTRSRERRGGRRPWTPGRAELAKEEHLQQRLKVWWEELLGGGSWRERTEGGRGEKARKDTARRFEQTKGDNRCGRTCGDRPMDIALTI